MPINSPQEPRDHYAYMVKVAEVCKPESYVASQETNWKMDMEEEMCALVENKTWDLVDSAKGIKPIG